MKKFAKLLSVALTGIILFNITVFSVNAEGTGKYVYLGGQSFGVKLYTDGVIIVNFEDYFDGTRYVCPAKAGGLKLNDIITKADGNEIKSNEDLQAVLVNSDGNEVELTIKRNDSEITKKVKPIKNTAGMYLIGVWIRDSCAGIGTITYFDEDNNSFAALGHGICDTDTSALMPLCKGSVVSANISGITKSVSGKAGSLNGYFTDEQIGTLTKNSNIGIYGQKDESYTDFENRIEIADSSEIKTGQAEIYTTINDDDIESYTIEITRICNKNADSNENFVIKITDERLMNYCGGIVQGMSGSPIVQNGKLVGAVTHVFINQPCEGYGVLIQNMVANYGE